MRQPRKQERLDLGNEKGNTNEASISWSTKKVKDSSFNIINWRLGDYFIINVGSRNIVFNIDHRNPKETFLFVMWEVTEESWENIKVVRLWSDVAWEIELDIKMSICDDQDLEPLETTILFWWMKWKMFSPHQFETKLK